MDVQWGVIVALSLIVAFAYLRDRHASFFAQRPRDYEGHRPDFDIRDRLRGPILCEGVVFGPFGRVATRFVGDFEGRWEGNSGVLAERFTYETGEVQTREWRLTLDAAGGILAQADDLVGEGRGEQAGSTLRMRYRIRLAEDAGGHVLDAVDWMYLAPNGTIVNRSQFRKFGLKVAELVAVMRRKEDM